MKTTYTLFKLPILLGIFLALLGMFLPPPGWAHHSRANFQLDNLVEMKGTVTRVRWANPHIYFNVELENGENWTIEGHSVPGAQGLGWTKDSLKIGDELLFAAFPERNTSKKFALLEWLVTADGIALAGFRSAQIPEQYTVAGGSGMRGRPGDEGVEPSIDFSGNWSNDLRGMNLRTGTFGPPTGLPLTARGEELAAEYHPDKDPNFQCVPSGYPDIMNGPYGYRIDAFEDRIEMMKEHDDVSWTVWLDESAAPESQDPSPTGLSTGRLEDDGKTLVFESTGFSHEPWGNARGIDSSEQKTVSTRLELQPDGLSIRWTYTVTDPVYFTEPVTRSGTFLKQPDRQFGDEPPCDPEVSSLHLNAG